MLQRSFRSGFSVKFPESVKNRVNKSSHSLSSPSSQSVSKPKPPLSTRIKEEISHYWHGTKLLAKEISISTRLLLKATQGYPLTRRENNQLVRTAKDLARMIPFLIFVVIPFMEFLLPVALKVFPNMLPSTYRTDKTELEKRKKMFKSRLEMAKFLRDSISESSINSTSLKATDIQEIGDEFGNFFKKYRTSGELAGTQEILEICTKFSDDLTLDNFSRPQLVTLSRFLGSSAIGTNNMLRFNIRRKLHEIERDDRMIMEEGIDSLTIYELITACQTRGIRTVDISSERLRSELSQWLVLHVEKKVPATILVLSRALMMTDGAPSKGVEESTNEALQTTLTSLPNEVVEEAELRLSEAEGKVSYRKKLDRIEKEEELIQEEAEEDLEESKRADESNTSKK